MVIFEKILRDLLFIAHSWWEANSHTNLRSKLGKLFITLILNLIVQSDCYPISLIINQICHQVNQLSMVGRSGEKYLKHPAN
jgi:hypothetical protein